MEKDSKNYLSNPYSGKEVFYYNRHTVESLDKMKSYSSEGYLTDVVLIAGKHSIPAHKLVLSAASEYFAAMFRSKLKEASQSEIELKDFDGDALLALITYCYTGRIELYENTVQTVLVTANILLLMPVVEACCKFIKKQLHASNCLGIKRFSVLQNCKDLEKASEKYIAEHIVEVLKGEEFLASSADEMAQLLGSDTLNVPSEEIVFNALMTWVEHDSDSRSEHFSKLLGLIRFPLLSPSFIVKHIETNPLFRNSPQCHDLILEAFKYRLLPQSHSKLQSSRTRKRRYKMDKLLVLGGKDDDDGVILSMERYDMDLNKWTTDGKQFARGMDNAQFAYMDGKLYIVKYSNGWPVSNTVQCYDLKTESTTNLPSTLTHRNYLGLVVLDGSLYAVGGCNRSYKLNTVERFNLLTGNWSNVRPMSTNRSDHAVAVLEGKLYCVGGCDAGRRSVECYDPRTNEWKTCASMYTGRSYPGVGVFNGCLYAVGGCDGGQYLGSVERYDPNTNKWTAVASMSCARDKVGVCVANDKLYAVGGFDGRQYLNVVEVYDPQKNSWQKIAPLTYPRADAIVINWPME